MSHTPGPWTYDYAPNGSDFVVGTRSNDVVALVGSDAERGITNAIVEANARLIAAAPELLEALRQLADVSDVVTGEEFTQIVARAEAAIAKAEGREP